MKICSKCREAKPLSDFNARQRSEDGHRSECRRCQHQINRAYLDANREAINQRGREKRAADPERFRKATKKWRDGHREIQNEKWHRRRARILNAFVENVNVLVLMERDGGICQLCRTPVSPGSINRGDTPSIDHIVPLVGGGSHSYANTQLAHFSCNARKGASISEAA